MTDRADSSVFSTDAGEVARLKAGDEALLSELVARHSPAMERLARAIMKDPRSVHDLVQDAWLAAIDHLDGFEGRASFKTWLFRILVNRARTTAAREARWVSLPLDESLGPDDAAVPRERFTRIGTWRVPPGPFPSDAADPEDHASRGQLVRLVAEAIDALPAAQRLVVVLRDVEECTAEEVSEMLSITMGNQRVLLHRGRSRVRAAVELRTSEVTR